MIDQRRQVELLSRNSLEPRADLRDFNFWQTPATGTNYTKTFTIYLTQASLSSVQNSASEGGAGPTESLSLRFQTIAVQDNLSGTVGCYNVTTKASSHSLTC